MHEMSSDCFESSLRIRPSCRFQAEAEGIANGSRLKGSPRLQPTSQEVDSCLLAHGDL
jgi:hypothetical protein